MNSTKELRENLKEILDTNFNKKYPRCPPHLYYFFSTLIGCFFLIISICLIKFIGNIGFSLLPIGIFGILSPIFFTCWSDNRNSSIFYKTITQIDSESFGVHKMTGSFAQNKYVNTITITTNPERLKRNTGIVMTQPAKKKDPKPKSNKVIDNKDIPLPTNVLPPKQGPTLPGFNPVQNPNMMNPGQPKGFNQPGMNPVPFPMQGPQQGPGNFNPAFNPAFNPMMNPNKGPMPGPFPNPGPFGFPPGQNGPFGNPMGPPDNDLLIHEINMGGNGGNNQMNYGKDLYTVPSNVIDEHGNGKKK